MKRFYDKVSLAQAQGGWQVTLDTRPIRTQQGRPQIVPSEPLAQALAAEWDGAGERIDPKAFPLRDMADYAIDVVAPSPQAVAGKLLAYGETDTLCYRAEPDEPLFERQEQVWEPLLSAFERREGAVLVRVSGVVHRPQDPKQMERLHTRMLEENPFRLAALEAMASLSASLVIGLSALGEESADEDTARGLWQAASLEEEWQAQLWGRDYEAEARRARREADFLAAWRFARLAAG
ncbi:Chaperone required for the assembly of the F1-ATPase [Erythrobacter litoralis]|uniref:Molecular chaperone n=1 Tax=Erythrobacter litoralis TaxID=39960 RepID=A0A074N5S4_9SPHN|nr:ATP12 family protein [Erythrobacter litoralis]AOL24428.1 Chaperone required for the assembly of the F1-ATPase [Erythrobacter litoralis]KEO93332.1 molecular chaperone [Erythrobacter litoralis]